MSYPSAHKLIRRKSLSFSRNTISPPSLWSTAKTALVGIITVDDIVDILQQEATEDIEKMAAITPTDKPYMKTGVLETWKKRIPWLLILMISATFTGRIISPL